MEGRNKTAFIIERSYGGELVLIDMKILNNYCKINVVTP